GDVVGGDRVMAAEPKLDVRALLERGLRELDPGLPGGPVRDDAHVVNRLHGGTGDNDDPLPLQLPRPDPADHALHDLLRVRELRQDGDDLGAMPDQLACQLDGLPRRDAPGDREDDLFPLQLLRLHGVDPAARMHGDAPKSDPAIYLSRARVGWGSPTVRNPYGGRIFPRRGGMSMQPAPVAPGPPLPPSEPWSGAPYVGMYPAPAPRGALRFMGIPIGVLLIVGLAILHIAILIPRPFSGFGQPDPATQAYLNTVRTLMGVAFGTVDVAIGLTVAFAWHAAVARPDLPEASRRGLMAFAGIFVGSWMIVTFVTVLLAGTFSIFFR